jgi:hypothetical protein
MEPLKNPLTNILPEPIINVPFKEGSAYVAGPATPYPAVVKEVEPFPVHVTPRSVLVAMVLPPEPTDTHLVDIVIY